MKSEKKSKQGKELRRLQLELLGGEFTDSSCVCGGSLRTEEDDAALHRNQGSELG